jgi:hypothetical protein
MTFACFTLGAMISAVVDSHLQFKSLIIPIGTSLIAAAVFFIVKNEKDSEK